MSDSPNVAGAGAGGSEVERWLVELGRSLDVPVATDPTARVMARLSAPPESRWRRASLLLSRGRRRAVLVAAIVLGGLALTPPGQAAVARVLEVFGVQIRIGEPVAPHSSSPLPGESASWIASPPQFTAITPAALGTPIATTLSDEGRVLSLAYGPAPGLPPADSSGVAARLDEFDGTLDPVFAKTVSAPAEYIALPDGTMALWIDGPHEVTYLDRHGTAHSETARMAARTLIWQVGSLTLRLEGNFTRESAVAIARSTLAE